MYTCQDAACLVILQREEQSRLEAKYKTKNSLDETEKASLRTSSSFQLQGLCTCLARSMPPPSHGWLPCPLLRGASPTTHLKGPPHYPPSHHPLALSSQYLSLSEMILTCSLAQCPIPPPEYSLYEARNFECFAHYCFTRARENA